MNARPVFFSILLVLANMLLFAFGRISAMLFWIVIVPVAVFAF